MEPDIKTAYEKFRRGDALSDSEMRALLRHLCSLRDLLRPFRDMEVVSRAVAYDVSMLESYYEGRR